MPDILQLDAAALTAAYAAGQLTPLDMAERVLPLIEGPLAALNAVASHDPEAVRAEAALSTARWQKGAPLGPLDGVPISFKDSFHMRGLPRWHGTACHPGTRSPADALPVERARAAGMIPVCKTTMPDFAMVMSGLSSQHGTIRNAWDPAMSPGGSSSGAPSTVVLGAATVALGTDMVGSVRLPAALSGLASIKPTQGRIAYDPPGAYRSAGPMARSLADVGLTLEALGIAAERDHVSLPGRFTATPMPERLEGRRIALWSRSGWGDAVDAGTATGLARAATLLADLGAEIVPIDDVEADAGDYMAIHWNMLYVGAPDYWGLSPAERGRIHPVIGAMYEALRDQSAIFAADQQRRIATAATRIARQLAPFDHVLSPALPVRAFAADLPCPDPSWGAMSHQAFACWFNQTGQPAVTLPVHQPGDRGVPVSVQITGRRFEDAHLLGMARLLEAARGFDIAWPAPAGAA